MASYAGVCAMSVVVAVRGASHLVVRSDMRTVGAAMGRASKVCVWEFEGPSVVGEAERRSLIVGVAGSLFLVRAVREVVAEQWNRSKFWRQLGEDDSVPWWLWDGVAAWCKNRDHGDTAGGVWAIPGEMLVAFHHVVDGVPRRRNGEMWTISSAGDSQRWAHLAAIGSGAAYALGAAAATLDWQLDVDEDEDEDGPSYEKAVTAARAGVKAAVLFDENSGTSVEEHTIDLRTEADKAGQKDDDIPY